MYITKETKWHLSCCRHDNSYAAGPVLIKTNIIRFYLKQGSSTPNNLMGRVKTIWESCVFPAKPSVPFRKVANWHIWFFHRKRLEPKVLPWQQHNRCYFVSLVMCISGAKVEVHRSNRGIHVDVIVYIFAHLHTPLHTEGNMLDMNWLQAPKELVKLNTRWNF